MDGRVVVTGLGAVTPLGNDVPTFWAGLVAGRSGVGPMSAYDADGHAVRIAAEVKDLDVTSLLGPKQARRLDRFSQIALIASDQAVADAGLDFADSDLSRNAAVLLGTAVGGITTHAAMTNPSGPATPLMRIEMALSWARALACLS